MVVQTLGDYSFHYPFTLTHCGSLSLRNTPSWSSHTVLVTLHTYTHSLGLPLTIFEPLWHTPLYNDTRRAHHRMLVIIIITIIIVWWETPWCCQSSLGPPKLSFPTPLASTQPYISFTQVLWSSRVIGQRAMHVDKGAVQVGAANWHLGMQLRTIIISVAPGNRLFCLCLGCTSLHFQSPSRPSHPPTPPTLHWYTRERCNGLDIIPQMKRTY